MKVHVLVLRTSLRAFAIGSAIFPVACHATTWQFVVDDVTASVFVDAESVRREGRRTRAWFLWQYAQVQQMDTPAHERYISVKSLALYDCAKGKRAILAAYYYNQRGGMGPPVGKAVLDRAGVAFEDVVPDSIGAVMLESVCAPPPARRRFPRYLL